MDQLRILRDDFGLEVRSLPLASLPLLACVSRSCPRTACHGQLFVHPIVPVLNETRRVVKRFNRKLAKAVVAEPGIGYLDFFDSMLTSDKAEVRGCPIASPLPRPTHSIATPIPHAPPQLVPEFALDGTHLSPTYLPFLARAMTKVLRKRRAKHGDGATAE